MASISLLKEKFDALPFSEDNIALYSILLQLDISDFKPIMEEILSGRINIEDTRAVFANTVNSSWDNGYSKIEDTRISTDISETIKSNLIARMSGNGNDIVKENLIFPDTTDLKYQIAAQFKETYGITLPAEDIEKLLPLVEMEVYSELSMNNTGNATINKTYQTFISDSLSYKPNVEL
jgi:hypothetical protein